MPHLMVNLEDVLDCEKALKILRSRLGRGGGKPGQRSIGEASLEEILSNSSAKAGPALGCVPAELPLPQKLKRIQNRGMWKHLVRIARTAQDPLSLPELDSLLDMPKNKMRSLKAIMAKLENRFSVQFLKVAPDAGVDAAGNPRYVMLPNVRRQILRLADEMS